MRPLQEQSPPIELPRQVLLPPSQCSEPWGGGQVPPKYSTLSPTAWPLDTLAGRQLSPPSLTCLAVESLVTSQADQEGVPLLKWQTLEKIEPKAGRPGRDSWLT